MMNYKKPTFWLIIISIIIVSIVGIGLIKTHELDQVTDSEMLGEKDISTEQPEIIDITSTPNLGGISLGDTSENVVELLGNNYSETTESDILGTIGEGITVWNYDKGITVSFGKTSGKVLRIASVNQDFQTDLGIKVGNDAETVFETYKPMYEEAKSRHRDEMLKGWFLIEDGAVIIFDFDKSDSIITNNNITPDLSVEEIILATWKHFD